MASIVRLIILVPFGLIVGLYAASLALLLVLFHSNLAAFPLVAALFGALALTPIVGFFAFVPAVVGIAVAEIFGLRSIFYFLLAGGLIGAGFKLAGPVRQALPPDVARWVGFGIETATGTQWSSLVIHPLLPIVAGFAGGLGYWLVAGRSAQPLLSIGALRG